MITEPIIGKVINYNGEIGSIITDKLEYKFKKNDTTGLINNNDLVEFIPNTIIFGSELIMVARFIKPYKQKKLKKNFLNGLDKN